MPQKHYPDIAAARHMRDPSPGSASPRPVSPPSATASPAPERRVDGTKRRSSGKSSAVARPVKEPKDKAYRRKRFIAVMVSTAVCISVPALIVLLVLFG